MRDTGRERRRDLLLTATFLCIALTPAWFAPPWLELAWLAILLPLGGWALALSWRHAPWLPTPRAELARVIPHLALRPGDRFVDLGAGDGRVVQAVARATGAHCVGIEASPLLAGISWIRLALGGPRGLARVRLGDLYAADLAAFDVAYVWGTAYSVGSPGFADWARRALRPGARLVSYREPVVGLEPVAVDEAGLRPIYVYVLPGP